jgi:hypothetical protein
VVRSHQASPLHDPGYLMCIVDVVEGVRIASGLRGCSLEDAAIGAEVELHFESLGGGFRLPVYRLVGREADAR